LPLLPVLLIVFIIELILILEDPRLDFEVFTGTMPTTALLRLVLVTFNVLFDVFVLLVS